MNTSKVCEVEGCDKPVSARSLCITHYCRLKRIDSLEPIYNKKVTQLDFIHNVALKHESDECLTWPFGKNWAGYAVIRKYNGKNMVIVSRLVCELAHGSPPTPKHEAAHSCGNGHEACVNQRHLSWKTPKENFADRIIHGNHPSGERNPNATLSDDEAKRIRELKGILPQREIAKIFGISQTQVSLIQSGKIWRHL